MYFLQIIWKDDSTSYFQFDKYKDVQDYLKNEDFGNILSYNLYQTKKITFKRTIL